MANERHAGRMRAALAGLMLGTAACSLAVFGTTGVALAQQTYSFSIPAQTLGSAVAEFARVTGWQVGYPLSLRDARTQAVQGSMAPEAALNGMLSVSGVSITRTGPTSVALTPAQTGAAAGPGAMLAPVVLEGESATGPVNGIIALRSATATKTDTPLIETPQTVNVIGREQMESQGATTVTDALRYTPGVVSGTNGGQSGRFDTYFVRGSGGFSAAANNANTVDGLRWRIPSRTGVQFDPWMMERVEVVKGPASTLFGSGSAGGVVNLVSKRPSFEKQGAAFATIGSYNRFEGGFDVTGPLSDTLAYRVIGLGRGADTWIDYQRDERFMFAPSLTWAPTDRTTLTFQALYQRDPQAPDANFVPAYGSVLPIPGYGTVDSSFWQGDPNYQEYERTQASIGWQFDHEFSDRLRFHSGFRYGKAKTTSKSLDFLSADGPIMYRYPLIAEHDFQSISTDNWLEGKFDLGQSRHTVLAGVDLQRVWGPWQMGSDYTGYPTSYPIDMFDPVYGIAINKPSPQVEIDQPFTQTGIYVQDQVAIGNWRFMAGIRHDSFDSEMTRTQIASGTVMSSSQSDASATTWRLGGVYLFDNGYAPFISYSTSFEPQLGVKANGEALDPADGRMLEAGLRYLSANQRLAWSATVYSGQYDKFAVTDSVNTAECAISTGSPMACMTDDNKNEFKGVELEARAQIAGGLDVIGSFTWQKARLTESADASINPNVATGDLSVDKHIVGVPETMASLWLNYQAPVSSALAGWTFGGGVRYVGTTYATNSNEWGPSEGAYSGRPSKVPAFTLFDAAVAYDFGAADPQWAGLQARLNVTNIFDKDYVAACNGYGTCSFGEPRMARLTLNYAW